MKIVFSDQTDLTKKIGNSYTSIQQNLKKM